MKIFLGFIALLCLVATGGCESSFTQCDAKERRELHRKSIERLDMNDRVAVEDHNKEVNTSRDANRKSSSMTESEKSAWDREFLDMHR